MTRTPHSQLLLTLRRFILRILKLNLCRKFLESIFRRLRFLWTIFLARWGVGRKGGSGGGDSSSSSLGGVQMVLKVQVEDGSMTHRFQNGDGEHAASACTTVDDGDVIPLQDISCSLFPYGSGIHSASRSTQNLRHARSVHDLAIDSRRGSRVSLLSSNGSHSPSAHDATRNFDLQSRPPISPISPTSPTPRRQYSISSPDVRAPTHLGFLTDRIPWTPRPAAPGLHVASPSTSVEMLSLSENTLNIHVPSSEISEIPSMGRRDLIPVIPENFQRYQKRQIISKTEETQEIEISPLETKFIDHTDPPGWTYFAHPEGAAYFYHEEKRIFTDTNLFDRALFNRINQDVQLIETHFTDNNLIRPPESDLVIDLNFDVDDTTRLLTHYYLADHESRVIFFLDAWKPDCLNAWHEVTGVTSLRQIGHEVEAQYWYHCQTYPNSVKLTEATVCELRDHVMHLIGDCMTSPYSTSPYPLEELYKILDLTDPLDQNAGKQSMGSMTLICRFFYIFARARFIHFHGTPSARLERDHSIYGTVMRRTWLIKTLSPLLFSAPDVHLRVLQKLWVDEVLHKGFYKEAMDKMNDEWQEFILFATVLLNANVAFLAIQTVDISGPNRSGAQIASYVSVFMSVGSIILGLLLVRQNRTKHRDSAEEVQRWLQSRSHPLLGLETLAIMFSLPYALLMWGMVWFLCSFSFMIFQDSSIPNTTIVGLPGVIIGFLILWCVYTAWEKQPEPETLMPLPKIPTNDDEPDEFADPPPTRPVSLQHTYNPATIFPTLRWRWPPFLSSSNRRRTDDSDATVV